MRKKMFLVHKNSSIEFIIKKWDLQSFMNIDDTNLNSLMFKNGSAVIIAKLENYDWRHIFVKSIDYFVDVCESVQTYSRNGNFYLLL